MGKALQIRVSAATHDPDDVRRYWPRLAGLAWGDRGYDQPGAVAGVRELVVRLNDLWKFGNDWPQDVRDAVGGALPGLVALDERLEAALADRRPDQADALSYSIEDGLDALEREVG